MADINSYLNQLPTGQGKIFLDLFNSGATLTNTITGNVTGALTSNVLQSAEHGAGVIGTGVVPRTYRRSDNGDIVTTIQIDLTGLACKGDAADDVIGLAAGGVAFIGRYVTATYGIVYKVEMSCIETAGEGTATITTDIDIASATSGTVEYDGAVGDVTVLNAGAMTAGMTASTLDHGMAANDYIYLVEGDTTAATGVYDAGQYLITFYGHALLA